MKILLTGATGFLGLSVVNECLKAGHQVRAAIRATSDVTGLEGRDGVEIVQADLADPEALKSSFTDAQAIIHCAGGGRIRRKRDFYLQNTATTENLVRALVESQHEVTKFVLVSSLAAVGPSQAGQPHQGDEAPHPRSHYGLSKLAAEEAVMALAKDLQVTIFRPPAIYGPGDNRFLPLFRAVKRGRRPVPPTKELSLIYVDDCSRAILAALGQDHPSGRHYYVEDGRPVSLPQLAEATAIAMGVGGKTLRPQRVRSWLFYVAGGLNEMRAKVTRKPVVLTRDKWRDGRHPYWTCDAARTEAELGWKPQVSLEDGLAMTAVGYRERGWL